MKKNRISLFVAAFVMALALTGVFAVAAKAAGSEDGLVAKWEFDGDIDESINALSTEYGSSKLKFIDGVYGKAAYFNGKNQYLIVSPNKLLNLGNDRENDNSNFTFSFWVNLFDSKDNGYKYVIDKGYNAGWSKDDDCWWSNPYSIYFDGAISNFYLTNHFEDTNLGIYTSGDKELDGKSIDGEEWWLMTYTYDGKVMKTYRNNELICQANYTDGMTFNNDSLYIGVKVEDSDLGCFFDGALDDLRIYNRTLSYSDVEDLYAEGVKANKELLTPTKQLVAYYAFDKDLTDSSDFKNDGEAVGKIKYTEGMKGDALTISDGKYASIPAAPQLNFKNDFTIMYWVKATNTDFQEAPILYRLNPSCGTPDNDNYWTYRASFNTWGDAENTESRIAVTAYDADSWCQNDLGDIYAGYYDGEDHIASTDWHHVAYTYTYDNDESEGMLKIYINGVLRNKNDAINLPDVGNASGDLLIGYDNDVFFKGSIDELKIYNKCLTDKEIKAEYGSVEEEDSYALIDDSKVVKKGIISIKKGKKLNLQGIVITDGVTGEQETIKGSSKLVKFASSKKSIFTVTSKGVITAKKKGTATLTVKYDGDTIIKYKVKVK